MNRDIETQPQRRISLKVAYFLSDCSAPGCGNTWEQPRPNEPPNEGDVMAKIEWRYHRPG